MRFGYFDDNKKEYVITNPATPASWSNYLGSSRYGAIITNNAGGYSFFKSAAQGRFMRFRTNSIPMDQPGRYLYLHDRENKDYWSASWQPVAKPLEKFTSECRHGTGYTLIESSYTNIHCSTTFFVPLSKDYEYWLCKITNTGNTLRRLRLFTFVEYSNHWNLYQDLVNLQYSQYILKMKYDDGIIEQGTNIHLPGGYQDITNADTSKHSFIGIAGAETGGFDTCRESFLGPYRSYSNPLVVEQGCCTQSLATGSNGCGCLQTDIDLKPGESKEFVVVMGVGQASAQGKEAINEASDIHLVHKRLVELKQYWHSRLNNFSALTPDPNFNSMFNMWNPYNCLITFAWSRAASLVYAGERDGYGYRDTVQDILGIIHILPEEAKERLELMITGQVSSGGAMPVVKFFDHTPGAMPIPDESEYRSDDCMWMFNTIPAYVKETGDTNFYSKVLPYADKGSDTVVGHLRKALEFSLERTGAHGLPCGLLADWNDCLELGHNGETVFVAFQLYYALGVYQEICQMLKMEKEAAWAAEQQFKLDKNIEQHAWDGDWYLRAYNEQGKAFGTSKDKEGSLWLNPQTWAIISGHAKGKKAQGLMKKVQQRLSTDHGLIICDPPYTSENVKVIKAVLFNTGMKENGAIFCHTQGWAVMAEALCGNGNSAFKSYKSYLPARYNEEAEVREIEPYVYSQSTHGKASPKHGTSRLPWLTGAASWAYFSAMQYILGIQPDYQGIKITPCIPAEWNSFSITRVFRGKKLNINIKNPDGSQAGAKYMLVNNQKVEGDFILFSTLKDENNIEVIM